MRHVFELGCAAALLAVVSLVAQTSGLRIVVLEGEDGVNIIQQRTAVQPVVEVRDRNNLPVAGAVVTFSLPASGGATFANSALQIAVTTDAAGRAAAVGLQPLAEGSLNVQVSASFQGQTATTTITQTNYATAQAAQAARPPSGSQSGANTGSAGSSGGSGAGAGAGAGAGGGAAGGLSGVAIGGIAAGGVVGAVAVAKAAGGDSTPPTAGPPPTTTVLATTTVATTTTVPVTTTIAPTTTTVPTPTPPACTSQFTAVNNAAQTLISVINSCATIPTSACVNSYIPAFNTYFDALNNLCACLGPSLTPTDRANLRDAYLAYQDFAASIGASVPPIPSCFQ